MTEKLIQVGRVAGAFGVKGEVRITAFTEDPMALLAYRDLKREDGSPGLTLTAARAAKGGVIARAREIETREEAEAMRGLKLFIPRDALPEPDEDEFYFADLVGLEARAPDGAVIGRVKAAQDFGAGDLLEIQPADGSATWWLPFTMAAAPTVNIAEGWLTVVRPVETE
ncbi:MAG: 16S rRNA processing protein RimM [Proteobacteria bacterium]|nr:16S rRNA processing protein RimM [Pseudomonadota bacterium]